MDYKNLWLAVLNRLAPTIARAKFLTWFRNTAVLSVEGETLVVGVPTAFVRDWIHSKYAVKILQAAQEQIKEIKEVDFAVDALLADGTDPRTIDVLASFGRGAADKSVRKLPGKQEVRVTTEGLRSARLNPRYTLNNFVAGPENRLAHAAALSVSRLPGQTYNPLFIYGGVGLGKTHLLSAIGHEVLANDPTKVVVYLTAEMFTNEYVAAVRNLKLDRFKQKYRSADVLLIDDIQFLEEKDKTQEEFFNVFNTLHNAGKQIVVTSDRPPAELTAIMDRLRSRLTWGLVTEIEQPEYESRLAILRAKTSERRAILDPEVLEFIALNVADSVRSLEGTLCRALAEADLLKEQPTTRTIAKLLAKLNKKERLLGVPDSGTRARSLPELLELTAEHFGVTLAELTGESRKQNICLARQVAAYLAREALQLSLGAIADGLHKNSATVLHSIKKVQASLQTDEALLRRLNSVKVELGL